MIKLRIQGLPDEVDDIYFVPFYNCKDGNSAFVRGGNLCSYFYQYTPIARIAGNHQL